MADSIARGTICSLAKVLQAEKTLDPWFAMCIVRFDFIIDGWSDTEAWLASYKLALGDDNPEVGTRFRGPWHNIRKSAPKSTQPKMSPRKIIGSQKPWHDINHITYQVLGDL